MKSRKLCLRALVALAGLGALGCGSGKDALEKRLASLQEELVAVQNSNDRLAERLMVLEMRQAQAPSAAPARRDTPAEPAEDSGVIERPPLKVVRLAPGAKPQAEGPEPAEEAEETGPRPVIRDLGSGKKARQRAAQGGVGQTDVRTEKPAGDY
jgi:hypothetical protein